ncbi:STAS domain-containing protein [Saccharopolyspora sp. MS10]|uniref:STAS domain-containing protein n=1 Tax=Saccharopolyspora sp. MS10 TaxID=3385973 RepID=UPI00399FB30D
MSAPGAGPDELDALPELSMRVEQAGAAAVLSVAGEIDMITAPGFQETLTGLVDDHPAGLVVDLTRVRFFASAGLSALVAAHERAGRGAGVVLRVVASESTAQPLRITALDRRMPVHRSVEDALAAFDRAAAAGGREA